MGLPCHFTRMLVGLGIIQIQTVTGFMNKENIVKNISLLSRKKSPTPNKSMNAQVSFKNINPTKSFYKHSHNHTDLSMSPITTKRIKTQAFR